MLKWSAGSIFPLPMHDWVHMEVVSCRENIPDWEGLKGAFIRVAGSGGNIQWERIATTVDCLYKEIWRRDLDGLRQHLTETAKVSLLDKLEYCFSTLLQLCMVGNPESWFKCCLIIPHDRESCFWRTPSIGCIGADPMGVLEESVPKQTHMDRPRRSDALGCQLRDISLGLRPISLYGLVG